MKEHEIHRTPKLNLITTIGERLDVYIQDVEWNFKQIKVFVDDLEIRLIELEEKMGAKDE